MAPRETENNAYAKFWGDKQRALWYVMVFSGVDNVIRLLSINTDNPGGNLMQKHKTIKFNVVGEQPATKYPKSALQT